MWHCYAQTVSVLHEAELISGRARLPAPARLPSQATAGEEGRAQTRALIPASLRVLGPASMSTLLHDFLKDVAAFKTARLLCPLTPFEAANLKIIDPVSFTLQRKGCLLCCCARDMGCQLILNPDPPRKLLASI